MLIEIPSQFIFIATFQKVCLDGINDMLYNNLYDGNQYSVFVILVEV